MDLCPWDFSGKNNEVDCHFLLQGIFLTQGSNSGLSALQADSLPSEPPGNPLQSLIKYQFHEDFPGSPLIKTLCFQCKGLRFNSFLGTKIPHAAQHGIFHGKEEEEEVRTKDKRWNWDSIYFTHDHRVTIEQPWLFQEHRLASKI